jgi:ribosomal protein S3AE
MENEKKDIESLTLEEFIILVKTMRFNQRRFRKSSKQAIREALEPLEIEVDDLIARFVERQTELF